MCVTVVKARIGWLPAVVFLMVPLYAHDIITTKITWSAEISRILYKRCISCHHEGGSAFDLTNYEQARPWAVAIAQQVLTHKMPPWNVVKGFGEFKPDRGLSQEEIERIADWVDGGAPEGNPAQLPLAMVIPKQETNPRPAHELFLSGSLVLEKATEVIGIRPALAPPGGVLQVVAKLPSGGIEPLMWFQNFNPNYLGVYYYRRELAFPAGTRVSTLPPGGKVALVVAVHQPASGGSGRITSVQKPAH